MALTEKEEWSIGQVRVHRARTNKMDILVRVERNKDGQCCLFEGSRLCPLGAFGLTGNFSRLRQDLVAKGFVEDGEKFARVVREFAVESPSVALKLAQGHGNGSWRTAFKRQLVLPMKWKNESCQVTVDLAMSDDELKDAIREAFPLLRGTIYGLLQTKGLRTIAAGGATTATVQHMGDSLEDGYFLKVVSKEPPASAPRRSLAHTLSAMLFGKSEYEAVGSVGPKLL